MAKVAHKYYSTVENKPRNLWRNFGERKIEIEKFEAARVDIKSTHDNLTSDRFLSNMIEVKHVAYI